MLSIYLILSAILGPGAYSNTNINEYKRQKYKMFLWNWAQLVHGDDILTAIYEPTF
jgi:hypothetical protein